MLHMRSVPVSGLLPQFEGLRDRLTASDGGLLRLKMSIRGTLSVFLTAGAAVAAGRAFGFSPVECAAGVTLGMMAPFLMREPTLQQRQRTLLALAVPAVGATLATTLLHGYGMAGDSLFLLLVFVSFLFGPRSPRGIGLGLVAVVTTYVGLYLELPPATLPVQVASQLVAVPLIALCCFVLVPMDQRAVLRSSVHAVQAHAARVIRLAGSGAPPHRVRRALFRLNQAALAADDQIALAGPAAGAAIRAHLVEVELWTARLVDAVAGQGPDSRLAPRLRLHARRIARAGRYAASPARFSPGTPLAALVALGQAVHALRRAVLMEGTAAAPALPAVPTVPPGPLAWRVAIRVTLAGALAMAGGMALSPQRWFWAVITVYVVFINARSRGDAIYKGVQRLGGTLLGIASGLVIATVLAGDGTVETVTLLLSIFGMYYFFLVSYTVGIFFVTVMLGLLYGLLGAPLEVTLTLRLEETLIGAASAIVVAAFVLPSRTRDQVRLSGRAVLRELAAVVRATRDTLAGETAGVGTLSLRAVDRTVADLTLAITPLVAGRTLLRRNRLERPVSALLECVQLTRLLAAEGQAGLRAGPEQLAALDAIAAGLAALGQGAPPGPVPVLGGGQGGLPEVIEGLGRSVSTLAARLEIGAYEGFAVGG